MLYGLRVAVVGPELRSRPSASEFGSQREQAAGARQTCSSPRILTLRPVSAPRAHVLGAQKENNGPGR